MENTPEYSVSEIAGALKRTVEAAFGQVRVRGELSQFRRQASGHWYGSLKDERALIDLAMWKGQAAALQFRPEDGMEVIITGRLTTYPGRSKYQLIIERMEPAGVGALLAQIEKRRQMLAAEGLFDAGRKQPLPYIPQVIGVITSPTGAVIRDILHRLADRFPRHVLVWPVAVQGEAAPAQIARAIAGFNAISADGPVPRPDVLIVARGGGSIEDLAAFNEELVVRAAAASAIPLISAVGHETDNTLIDFAADWRAPTPTAAAERAVPVRAELVAQVATLTARLVQASARDAARRSERLQALGVRLPAPRRLLELPQQRLDEQSGRLPRGLAASAERARTRLARTGAALRPALLKSTIDRARAALVATGLRPALLVRRRDETAARLGATARLLASLGPDAVLARGYALVLDGEGRLVPQAAKAREAARLTLRFVDGEVEVSPAPAQPRLL
jgi:exodeoxyribonuclease VII large subunit